MIMQLHSLIIKILVIKTLLTHLYGLKITATQSSTIKSASKAIDGDFNNNYSNSSCSCTDNLSTWPWWKATFDEPVNIGEIWITNVAQPSMYYRLRRFRVATSINESSPWVVCHKRFYSIQKTENPVVAPCVAKNITMVKIYLEKYDYLILCEVQFFYTIDGNWGAWRDLNACPTCIHSGIIQKKTRIRECNNPKPEYGGKQCEGDNSTSSDCTNIKPCPIQVIDGQWSEWSTWSSCPSTCLYNGLNLFRTKQRTCTNPSPIHGGNPCEGSKIEIGGAIDALDACKITKLCVI